MQVIIIEDEKPAAEKLKKALVESGHNLDVVASLGSIAESVSWLQQHPSPDLLFMDIELTDGLSFKIFDQVPITCPVIFTTAFDDYWQDAFEHNGIDYLLKPVKQQQLESALLKYEKLKTYFTNNFRQLMQWQQQTSFKKRFLVKRGTDYVTIRSEDIAYFYATHKLVCLVDARGQKFILDKSLADLERETDPAQFYRLNRKFLVNIQAIKKIKTYPKSKLLVEVDPPAGEEIIISQENAGAFKDWADK